MYRTEGNRISPSSQPEHLLERSRSLVNAIGDVDEFVTAEPTPKPESRRGWRRRRVRRGKS